MRSFMICRLSLTQYFSSVQIKKNEMGVACGAYRGKKCGHRLVGKNERKRPLGRPRCGLEDNIKIVLQEI